MNQNLLEPSIENNKNLVYKQKDMIYVFIDKIKSDFYSYLWINDIVNIFKRKFFIKFCSI